MEKRGSFILAFLLVILVGHGRESRREMLYIQVIQR
ncbi:hypothetical protein GLYMA_13G223651v4 [Glycine max]|nr:hypothetical protein GLYMA_13G223651v4 [Glycine max]KAH1102805.1 hypothetical protein GYH30_037037 [Glycine max]